MFAYLATFACSKAVFAQGEPASAFELTWRAPDGCQSQEQVQQQVLQLLGTASVYAQHVIADGEVRERAGTFELKLRLQTGAARDERTLSASSCRTAAETAALLIALAIDPALDVSAPKAAPALAAPLPRAPPATAPELAASTPPSAMRVELGAGVLVDTVLLPAISASPALRAGLGWKSLHVSLQGGYLLARSAHAPGTMHAAYADFDAFWLALAGCYLVPVGVVELGACAQAGSASLRAAPHALERTARSAARADFLGLAFAANLALAPQIFLEPALGLSVVTRRPVFTVAGTGTLHQPRAVGGFAALSCVFQLE